MTIHVPNSTTLYVSRPTTEHDQDLWILDALHCADTTMAPLRAFVNTCQDAATAYMRDPRAQGGMITLLPTGHGPRAYLTGVRFTSETNPGDTLLISVQPMPLTTHVADVRVPLGIEWANLALQRAAVQLLLSVTPDFDFSTWDAEELSELVVTRAPLGIAGDAFLQALAPKEPRLQIAPRPDRAPLRLN
ncbi:hypothetical protein [Deinococcus soli (ex Cha et al. 2016)]|uniref:Uncharacterized protein n=2 Tax=Deinococcus soli (ex Cha et al. 2016) TaxID=1309411 RepID=A0AAE3XE40_9DEIO|nr:hypothetical protein [Deinococcus soli (ex Cha et al. 2016)]MDR6218425.1 hypothetical protein [Deinococcus soli (ex Cha et al. 2016)]MDR6329165.1 hypothetical protein [Deinococcus soli (ex Cha et al. 2016)]MDR6751438.1 hypothetical protein [Deinococcus soli (ex Cha et al. 2016)]